MNVGRYAEFRDTRRQVVLPDDDPARGEFFLLRGMIEETLRGCHQPRAVPTGPGCPTDGSAP